MDISYTIHESDKEKAKQFYSSMVSNKLVQKRTNDNIKNRPTAISRKQIWVALVTALLTSQQRSGPNSAIAIILNERPFPLALSTIDGQADIKTYIAETLQRYKGIRNYNRIAQYLTENYDWLNNNGWKEIQNKIDQLINESDPQKERDVSNYLISKLKGIGPKQSRNLLQMLGLTKYEIPLDSRIMKWLNSFGFPIKLNSTGLSDSAFYEFVGDGVIALCKEIGIYPCELDAAIFASFDGNAWNKVLD